MSGPSAGASPPRRRPWAALAGLSTSACCAAAGLIVGCRPSACAQSAYIDAAHRVHARVEDVTGKDTGLGHFPSHDYKVNQAWLDAAMTACILLSWLKLIALDSDLARAEPKTLRRILHAAARLVRGGRRRCLKIASTWPWAQAVVTAWQRIQAIPHPT